MKTLKKLFTYIFFAFLGIAILGSIFLFTTQTGHKLRLVAAEVILSSQHRSWAKYTFLSQEELDTILKNINDPEYLNTHDTDLNESILDSIENGDASFKDSTEQLSALYEKMVNERKAKETNEEQTLPTSEPVTTTLTNESKLIVKVETVEGREADHYFKGKLMTVSNPKNVKLALSKGEQISQEYGEQIDVIAKRENAIAATNASGFVDVNGVGNGGTALGIVIEKGDIKNTPGGADLKDFVAGLTKDGLLVTGNYTANELASLGVQYAAGFKPQLIANGKKMITEGNGGWGYGPRTAIGQKADGSILLLVVDGRQTHSIGASMKEIQDILYDKGAVNALAMDGGSSAIMYFNGKNITTPSSVNNIPRYIPNAWVVQAVKGQEVEIYENDVLVKSYVAQ